MVQAFETLTRSSRDLLLASRLGKDFSRDWSGTVTETGIEPRDSVAKHDDWFKSVSEPMTHDSSMA